MNASKQEEETSMKRKILFTVLCVLTSLLLAACQCNHDWVSADCTTAKTCARCKEEIGQPLGHSWIPGTCTTPTRCERCQETTGSVSGHNWIGAVNRSGIEGRVCTVCQEMEMNAYQWIPLTEFEKVKATNEEAHFQDILTGDWDTRAGELPDAIRFCVSGKENYRKVHSVTYKLGGNFQHLSGLVSFMDKSDKYATFKIQVYLDDKLEFESNEISALTADQSFTLDAINVKMVRIVWSTTDEHTAYCALSASVY